MLFFNAALTAESLLIITKSQVFQSNLCEMKETLSRHSFQNKTFRSVYSVLIALLRDCSSTVYRYTSNTVILFFSIN